MIWPNALYYENLKERFSDCRKIMFRQYFFLPRYSTPKNYDTTMTLNYCLRNIFFSFIQRTITIEVSKPKINFSSSAPPPPPPARSGFFFSSDEIINGCCYIRHLAVGYLPCYFCHSRFVLSSVPPFLILIIIFGLLSFLSGAIALHQCQHSDAVLFFQWGGN